MENTKNPWLDIPLAVYERHMAHPEIGQAQMLADELEFAVRQHSPKSLALIGCSGGNELNRLVDGFLGRFVGIDINPAYVEAVRSRFGAQIPGLELHIADIQFAPPKLKPVDLLFAALILEYVDVRLTMGNLRRLSAPGGTLVVILQAPSPDMGAVSASPYKSIQVLASLLRPLDQEYVHQEAAAAGFLLASSRIVELRSGKRFVVLSFVTNVRGGSV